MTTSSMMSALHLLLKPLLVTVVTMLLLHMPLPVGCDTNNTQYLYFTPNDSTPCAFNAPCLTLDQYASNTPVLVHDNVTLHFILGVHLLSKQAVISFTNGSNIYFVSNNSLTTIACSGQSAFEFSHLENVFIANITFQNCGATSSVNVASFYAALAFNWVLNLNFENLTIFNSSGIGIAVKNSFGRVNFRGLNVSYSKISNVVMIWNASCVGQPHFSFILEDSQLLNGGTSIHNTSDILSGGLDIQLIETCVFTDIQVNNVSILFNLGYRGGNLAVTIQEQTNQSIDITVQNSRIGNGMAITGGGIYVLATGSDTCDTNYFSTHNFSIINSSVFFNLGNEAGGISVNVNKLCQRLDVHFFKVHFHSNMAKTYASGLYSQFGGSGGGALISAINDPTHSKLQPLLIIENSNFSGNIAETGGGLSVIHTYTYSNSLPRNETQQNVRLSQTTEYEFAIQIIETRFTNNTAGFAGGIYIKTEIEGTFLTGANHLHNVILEKVVLTQNSALKMSHAMHISTFSRPHDIKQYIDLYYVFKEVNVTTNGFENFIIPYPLQLPVEFSTVSLHNIPFSSFTDCSFISNNATALAGVNSNIRFNERILFVNNTANVGGGLALYSSYVILSLSSQIKFSSNHARLKGGGIYVQDYPRSLAYNTCFLQYEKKSLDQEYNVRIDFDGNTAGLAGSDLYGGRIELCDRVDLSVPLLDTLHLNKTGTSTISSGPLRVCICIDGVPNCTLRHVHIDINPNIPFSVSLVAVGQMDGITSSYIKASFAESSSVYEQFLSRGLQQADSACTDVVYTVSSMRGSELLLLLPVSFDDALLELNDPLQLNISFCGCTIGFVLSGTPRECQCAPEVVDNGLSCNLTDSTVSRVDNVWIGLLTSNFSTDIIVHNRCPFDYCRRGEYSVDLQIPDSVCSFNRTGLLCGECSGDLSITLGTSKCKQCSNNYIAMLLIFGLAGVILVMFLTALNLSVTEGTINGLIFYANILHLNQLTFFPNGNVTFLTVFISWINLDFGFDMCFYSGMTTFSKTWFQFLFPLYILIIVALIVVFSQHSSKLARITGAKNRVKVMSTLFLLSYLKILRTVSMILTFTNVSYPNGTVKKVWLYDANIEYLHGKHVVLFCVAVMVIVFLAFPYSAFITFIQCWQRLPNFRWRLKLYAVLDSYAGPFKTRYRFWIGLLLLTYSLLLIIFSITGGEATPNLAAAMMACSLLLFLKFAFGGVFKKWPLDVLEAFFLLNIVITSTVLFSVYQFQIHIVSTAVNVMVSFAFIAFVIIVLYHIYQSSSHIQKLLVRIKSIKIVQYPLENFLPRSSNHDYRHLEDSDIEMSNQGTIYHDSTESTKKDTLQSNVSERNDFTSEWEVTKYPENRYREDPILLSTPGDNATPSSKSQAKPTLNRSTNSVIQPLVLVVNRNEEEAILIEDSTVDAVNLQKKIIDEDGATTIVIDSKQHQDTATSFKELTKVATFEQTSATYTTQEQESPDLDTDATGQKNTSNQNSLSVSYCNEFRVKRQIVDLPYPTVHSALTKKTLCPAPSLQFESKEEKIANLKSKAGLEYIVPLRKKRSLHSRKQMLTQNKKGQEATVQDLQGTVYLDHAPPQCLVEPLCVLCVKHTGIDYQMKAHDIAFKVPPGALSNEITAKIEFGVLIHGPFSFPPNMKPVSPIVWICSQQTTIFQKPFELMLPHIFDNVCTPNVDEPELIFMKAQHHTYEMLTGDKKRFEFVPVDEAATCSFTSYRAVLKSKHFCFYCVAAKQSRKLLEKARYCLTRVDPKPWLSNSPDTTIYFCVSYFMKTCLEALKKQFNDEFEIKSRETFNFSTSDCPDAEPKITIEISQRDTNSRWFVMVENQQQISASKIDFWQYDEEELQLLDNYRMYPPRFQVKISGRQAIQPSYAQVRFSGTKEDISCAVYLDKDFRPSSRASARYSLSSSDLDSYPSYRSTSSQPAFGSLDEAEELEDYSGLEYEPEMSELHNEVISTVASKWYIIGVQLRVRTEDLDKISVNHAFESVDIRCIEVFKLWRRRLHPRAPFTWATMIKVLKTPAVGEIALAENLKVKLARPVAYLF